VDHAVRRLEPDLEIGDRKESVRDRRPGRDSSHAGIHGLFYPLVPREG
jgi:hypothetical protein